MRLGIVDDAVTPADVWTFVTKVNTTSAKQPWENPVVHRFFAGGVLCTSLFLFCGIRLWD
jgi:hypothetical protein